MRLSFYTKMLNSLEKVEVVTLEEKQDKAQSITSICDIIRERDPNISITWDKNKWKVAESLPA